MSQNVLPCLSETDFAALQAQCKLSAEAIERLVAEIHEAEPIQVYETDSGTLQENALV